jgi:hypothetical protein
MSEPEDNQRKEAGTKKSTTNVEDVRLSSPYGDGNIR